MPASRIRWFVLGGVLAVALSGCQEATFSTSTVPVGVLSVFSRSANGAYVARPEALFARAGAAPSGDSRSTVDTCQLTDYVPQSTIPSIEQIHAGDSVVFAVETDTTILRPVNRFGVVVYAASPVDVPIVPGALIRFAIPGAVGGFSSATISSLTPPALTSLTPISSRPPVDQPLALTWEPVGDDSARFEVLLIYAEQGAMNFNQQVVCEWRDDGSGTIRAELLSGWRTSELQRIEVTRYRTQRRLMGDTVLFLLATFDSVPPVEP